METSSEAGKGMNLESCR